MAAGMQGALATSSPAPPVLFVRGGSSRGLLCARPDDPGKQGVCSAAKRPSQPQRTAVCLAVLRRWFRGVAAARGGGGGAGGALRPARRCPCCPGGPSRGGTGLTPAGALRGAAVPSSTRTQRSCEPPRRPGPRCAALRCGGRCSRSRCRSRPVRVVPPSSRTSRLFSGAEPALCAGVLCAARPSPGSCGGRRQLPAGRGGSCVAAAATSGCPGRKGKGAGCAAGPAGRRRKMDAKMGQSLFLWFSRLNAL